MSSDNPCTVEALWPLLAEAETLWNLHAHRARSVVSLSNWLLALHEFPGQSSIVVADLNATGRFPATIVCGLVIETKVVIEAITLAPIDETRARWIMAFTMADPRTRGIWFKRAPQVMASIERAFLASATKSPPSPSTARLLRV